VIRRLFVLAALSAATLPVRAQQAVELDGQRYEAMQTVAGTRLVLNGAGIRYKAIFKVYTAGLYLTAKAATPEAVLAGAGPKRLHIVMLRDIDANELGRLFTRGMEDNASRSDFSKSIPGTLRLADMFAQKKKLVKGENFTVDWLPGTGTQILVNGQPQGEPIREPEFFGSLMRIWLGSKPADAALKDQLLGKPAEARRDNSSY
jgi:hypothetical protein